jgi:hypothetical protein
MSAPSNNFSPGNTVEPPNNPGTFIGKIWRAKICGLLTCFLNPKIRAVVIPSDGSPHITVEAEIAMAANGWTATIDLTKVAGVGGGYMGGYMGEYDPTVAYTTGQTFKITAPLTITIASVNYIIAAGYWGVRPAASVVDSQGFGPWAGSLPVNPTTAGIDMDKMFFNAENTAPTMGTGLNSKLYAELITATCAT